MNELLCKAVLAGVMFGCWPLFISKSGLSGSSVTLFGGIVTFMFVAPFALMNGISLSGSRWWIIIITGIMAGIGCLAFNDMMVKAKPASGPLFFIIMLVVQTMMPAVYHIVINQQFSIKTIAGFIAAIVACILLSL